VAKFLPGLDVLMPPLVGAEGVSLTRFVVADALGGFLWSGVYAGLGYVFSRELDLAIHWVEHFGTAVAVAIGVPVCLYAAWRGLALVQTIRRLRLRRISPPLLARILKSSKKVAVLDLREFEAESDTQNSSGSIPGAFRVDPFKLRKTPRIVIPHDVDVVLYSSLGGAAVSARAAMALKRIGVDNVWVLEGGLKAWLGKGLPVSKSPVLAEVAAERVGVKLPPV